MTTLSSLVIARQAASMAQVDEALTCQVVKGGDLGTCLLELGAITEEVLLALVGEAYGLEPLRAGPLPSAPGPVLQLVPRAVVLRFNIYPIRERDGELHVAVAEPLTQAVEDDLAFALGTHLRQFAAAAVRIREAIARDYAQPLERRFLRVLAKLESLPDPSPSILPPPVDGVSTAELTPVEHRAVAPTKRTWPGMLVAPRDERRQAAALSEFAPTPAMPPVSELSPTPLVPPVVQVSPMAVSIPPASVSIQPASLAPPQVGTQPASRASRPRSAPPDPRDPPGPPPHDFVVEAMMATAARVEKRRRRRAEQPTGKALLGWARRALGDPIPADVARDRRWGPLTPAAAELQLEDAPSGEEALAIFFAFARQYFEYTALFVVHGDLAAGHDAWGRGAGREKVRTIGVALDLPSALSHARAAATPVIAPLEQAGLDADLRTDLGRSAKKDVLVLPVVVLGRAVALLYADQGDESVDAAEIGAVMAISALLATALERILLRKKRAMVRDSLRAKAAPEAGQVAELAVSPDERTSGKREGGTGPFVPANAQAATPLLVVSDADADGSMRSLLHEMDAASSVPAPSTRPSSAEGGDELLDPLASASVSASPHPPPASRVPYRDLPRVLIRSDLVDLVIAGGERGEKALGEILTLGETAIPSVFARFPGPLTVDRNQAIGDLPRPADCGPVLRIVAAMRRLALPFLAVRSADSDVEVRFWATYLLGELNYADVAAALVPRLFDENTSVRRIAVRSARTLAAGGDQGVPLRKSLERTIAYADEPAARRLIALWTIGELRFYRSIPTLIAALSDPLDSIAEASQRSLTAMTRQEFGRDAHQWSEWWETKGKKRLP